MESSYFFRVDMKFRDFLQPIKCQCCSHIETSQLIFTTNQLTGFYMRATLAFIGLKLILVPDTQLNEGDVFQNENIFFHESFPLRFGPILL